MRSPLPANISKALKKIPRLSASEERDLVVKFRGGDKWASELLILSQLRFVISIARKYRRVRRFNRLKIFRVSFIPAIWDLCRALAMRRLMWRFERVIRLGMRRYWPIRVVGLRLIQMPIKSFRRVLISFGLLRIMWEDWLVRMTFSHPI